MDATIVGLSTEQAYYIVDSINPDAARVSGVGEDEVTISPEGLAELARFDKHADGHFDGRHVWIGGVSFPVRGV
jgi:hypothetical protein